MLLNTVMSNINLLAVFVAGIIHMATGLIWFMPGIFGKRWMELTKQDLKPARQWIVAGFIGHQVIAYTLAVIIYLADATTVSEGIIIAVLLWVGFIVTLETGELIWEKIPFRLFLIRIGNHLMAMSFAGAILSVWR